MRCFLFKKVIIDKVTIIYSPLLMALCGVIDYLTKWLYRKK